MKMSTVFVEAVKPFTMPGGGVLNPGEIASLDPVTAASLIASGIAVSSSAPSAPSAPAMTRVKFTETTFVNNSPPLFDASEVATFPSAVSAALIASGAAVAN
jgi:hypothetical protein